MRIDLNCPIELWRLELPRENYRAISLMMYNLCDRIVVSVEVTLSLRDPQGHELERVIYRSHDLDGRPQTAFAMNVPLETEYATLSAAECTITKVWFSDNSVWRHTKGSSLEYTPNTLKPGRQLDQLRFLAGKGAVGFPEKQDSVWLCVCGRPNAIGENTCRRCHQPQQTVFEKYNRETVEKLGKQREQQLALNSKAALEKTSYLQQQRENEFILRKKKRARAARSVITAATVLALAYGCVFHGLPYLRYRQATDAMSAGRYTEAITAFEAMPGYRDSDALLTECRYQAALSQFKSSSTAQEFLTAGNALRELGDYADAADYALQADYLRANALLEAGDTASAAAIYDALGDYENSRDQRHACDAIDAGRLMESGDYDAARAIYLALGDYGDSAEKAADCLYLPGEAALRSGEYDTAAALLRQIPGHRDADALLQQAYAGKAAALETAGQLVEAADFYLLAGDLGDCADQAKVCLYRQAAISRENGDLNTAADLLARIPGYEDADTLYNETALTLARTALNDKEYNRAISLLRSLPEGYEDSASLLNQAVYEASADAYTRGDYQTAVDGYASLGKYKSSASRLTRARYKLAAELVEKGDYAAAIEQYVLLGKYEDSRTKLRAARYTLGNQLMSEKRWHEAAEQFSQLSNYKDAETKWKEATWNEAGEAFDAGDYPSARSLYASLGRYSTARDRVHDCDYAAAEAILADGDILGAAQAFASVSWQDSDDRSHALYSALADEAMAAGEVLTAGQLYAQAGTWEGADQKAKEAFDSLFGEGAELARNAMQEQRYADAVAALSVMDLSVLPDSYDDLAAMWQEANYLEAMRLYRAGQPYDALPYFDAVRGYKDVDTTLQRTCYLIIGTWRAENGREYIFRTDGTCSLNGEEAFFSADTYALNTGSSAKKLSNTFKISTINETDMTLRDIRNGNNLTIRVFRVPEEAPAAETAQDALPLPEEATPTDISAATATDLTALPLPGAPEGGN